MSKHKDLCILLAFFLSIAVISSGMVFRWEIVPQNEENRKLAAFPTYGWNMESLKNFPKSFARYFNEHFGFRSTLVSVNFLIRHNLLHESPSEDVIVGKNGWLFYTADGAMQDYRGITHFDGKTLERLATSYEWKREWLSNKGIRYILVIAPNKETIYGEWMPDYYSKTRDRSGLDEVIEYLRAHTKVDVIDLRRALIRHKAEERLYPKTSSIWNDYGAFLAYREIMKLVSGWFPVIQARPVAAFRIEREEIRGDDLAEMIGGAEFLREKDTILVPRERRKAETVLYKPSGSYKYELDTKLDNEGYPRALVFRDCFFTKIIPFLSEHFQYSKYYWQSWDPDTGISDMIDKYRPDLVIEERVERYLKFPTSP